MHFHENPIMAVVLDALLDGKPHPANLCREYCHCMEDMLRVGDDVARENIIRSFIGHLPRLRYVCSDTTRDLELRTQILGRMAPQALARIFNATFTRPAPDNSPISYSGICDLFGLYSGRGELNLFINNALQIIDTPTDQLTLRLSGTWGLTCIFQEAKQFLGTDDFAQHYTMQVETMRGKPHNALIATELSTLAQEL